MSTALCSRPCGASASGQAGCKSQVQPHMQCHQEVGTDVVRATVTSPSIAAIPVGQFLLQGPRAAPAWPFQHAELAEPQTHLFVHRALLHLRAVPLGRGGLLPEAGPAAGPVWGGGHHGATGGSLVLNRVQQGGRRPAAGDGRGRRRGLVDAPLRAGAVLPRHGGLPALLRQRELPAGQLPGPAGEVLAGRGGGEAQLAGRQLLAVAVRAERAVALGAGVAQAAGGQRQPRGHLVDRVLEGERRQQLGPAGHGLAARRGGGLPYPAHGGHGRHAALLSPCGPYALQLPERRLTVIEGVSRARRVGPTVQEPIVLQVHHGQTLAAIRHLHVGLIGL